MKIIAVPVDLLPCPFCGETPDIETWHGGKPTKHMVSCINNECTCGPQCTGETHALAVKNWNTRAATPPQSEHCDAALDAIINAGSLGQARRITMQALGDGDQNDAPEQSERGSITSPSQEGCAVEVAPVAAPRFEDAIQDKPLTVGTLTGTANLSGRLTASTAVSTTLPSAFTSGLTVSSGFITGNIVAKPLTGNAGGTNIIAPMPDVPAASVSSAEAYAMDCEGYAAPAAPTRSGPNTDVVCHAPGYKCLGCAHYYGKAPVCEYAPASTLPLSAEQINEQLKGFHSGFYYDVLQQAMRAVELEQRVKEAESNAAFDSRLAAERGEKLAEAMQTARDKLLGWEQAEARCKELERHLKAQAEWGLNQFDRAEKAVAAAAEKDREIALLLAESVLEKERTKTAEAELAELKARAK